MVLKIEKFGPDFPTFRQTIWAACSRLLLGKSDPILRNGVPFTDERGGTF